MFSNIFILLVVTPSFVFYQMLGTVSPAIQILIFGTVGSLLKRIRLWTHIYEANDI